MAIDDLTQSDRVENCFLFINDLIIYFILSLFHKIIRIQTF